MGLGRGIQRWNLSRRINPKLWCKTHLQRQNHPSHVALLRAYDHRPGTLCDWYYKGLGVSPVHETARPPGGGDTVGIEGIVVDQ